MTGKDKTTVIIFASNSSKYGLFPNTSYDWSEESNRSSRSFYRVTPSLHTCKFKNLTLKSRLRIVHVRRKLTVACRFVAH